MPEAPDGSRRPSAPAPVAASPSRTDILRSAHRARLVSVVAVCAIALSACGIGGGALSGTNTSPSGSNSPEVASPIQSPSANPVAEPAPSVVDPCASATNFEQAVKSSDPQFIAMHRITAFQPLGCQQGIAVARGIVPGTNGIITALFPVSSAKSAHTIKTFPSGTACSSNTGLPDQLALTFCAKSSPLPPVSPATSTTPATSSGVAALAGQWNEHGAEAVFDSTGHGKLDYRTYQTCPSPSGGPPCEDPFASNAGHTSLLMHPDGVADVTATNDPTFQKTGLSWEIVRPGVLQIDGGITGLDYTMCWSGVSDQACGQ